MTAAGADASIDPITLEVIRCGLVAVTNQIDANISRTAYSPIVYEYKDYAAGILDADGQLVCQCTGGIPIFIADILGVAVRDGLAIYGRNGLAPGDVVITNHPGTIGQHLNNVVMYTPVFAAGSEGPVAFMAVVMHWMDVGGRVIGSVSKWSTDIFQEGLQLRTVKLQAGGRPVAEIYRIIEGNTRFPGMVLGDVEAQVAGCLMGRDLVARLVERYGIGNFRAAVATIWQQSEAAARAAVARVPDGVYRAGAELDDDGIDTGRRLAVEIVVRVAGEELTIDLGGLPPQVAGPINSGAHGGGHTCARIAFKYLFAPDEPANEGTFRPLRVVLPEGTILSASPTAAMGRYNMPLPTVIDTVMRALAAAMPERVAGGHFGTFSSVQFSGRHGNGGGLFQCNDSGHGGWGAVQGADGSGPFRTMAHGDTRLVPVEVQEALYPIRIEAFELRADSGGPGTFRGGLGLRKRYRVLAPLTLMTAFERTQCPPWGVQGGGAGRPGRVLVRRRGGDWELLLKGEVELQAGDQLLVETGGGGGYGPPAGRAPDRLADDLRQGYVTPEHAADAYGFAAMVSASAPDE